MAQIKKFIDYCEDLQKTVPELIDYMKDYISKNDIDKIVIIFAEDENLSIAAASESRDYKWQEVNWDLDQIKNFMISGLEDYYGE